MSHRILIVASHFAPRHAAGVYRTLRFARFLPELGWDVHVLTVDPASYEAGARLDESLMAKVPGCVVVHRTRAAYPAEWARRIRRSVGSESESESGSGAHSHSSPSPSLATHSNGHASPGLWQRLKDAITVPLITPDKHIGWLPFAARRGKRIIRQHGIEVIYSSGPPWTDHLVGLRLARSTRRPWVADFRDPWLGADFRAWRRGAGWAARKHQRLERRVVDTADCVVMNTPRAAADMLERYGDSLAAKLVVILNGYDPADYEGCQLSVVSCQSEGNGKSGGLSGHKLVIAHAGSFYGKRNVGALIEAVGRLCREGTIPRERIEVRLIGADRPGRSVEREQAVRAGVEDVVTLTPPVPHDECLRQLAAADLLLLVQVGAPLSVPGKVFEYIALGKPVLTLASEGATADLVRAERLGPCVAPDDPAGVGAELAELFRRFAAGVRLGGAGPETRARYDGRRLTGCLHAMLTRVVEQSRRCTV